MFLLLYADDLLLITLSHEHTDWFFKALGEQVLLKHTGQLLPGGRTLKFLGKLLTHRGDNIVVRPLEGYCEGILKLYNLGECKPVTTTGTSALKRIDDGDDEVDYAEAKLYRTLWEN